MKTAEEYFESKNGGKPASDMVRDNEYITATWAVILMRDYASSVTEEKDARIGELERKLEACKKLARIFKKIDPSMPEIVVEHPWFFQGAELTPEDLKWAQESLAK